MKNVKNIAYVFVMIAAELPHAVCPEAGEAIL